MKISLVDIALVDSFGVGVRLSEDSKVFGISVWDSKPEGFKDWGSVEYNGNMFYMSSYDPQIVEEEADAA